VPVFSCGRSLYIDWRMVVMVGENVLHHVKKGGIVRAGECLGKNMSEGEMSYTLCCLLQSTTISVHDTFAIFQ